MKYIDRLLQGAPVEWLPLGEVCEVKTGSAVSKKLIADNPGIYPVINSGKDPLGFIDSWNTENDPLGITSRGAGVGSVTWQEGRYFRGNLNYSVTVRSLSVVSTRFLYYVLLNVQKEIQSLCTFQGIPALNASNLKKLEIPIPPVAVQEEVVRVLDKFTALEAELEAELDCRKRQYQYYRDALLSFDLSPSDGLCYSPLFPAPFAVEWLPLGEVFEMRNGYTPSKSNPAYWEGGTIPWFRMEDLRTSGRILEDSIQHITLEAVKGKGLFKASSILMATTATIGEHALLVTDSLANQRFTNFEIHESLLGAITPMFAYYYFFLICEWCKRNVYESSFPSVDMKSLREVHFPIPPLAVQERIVEILDKFDTLVNSISEGLPREIELRRKQYEYYRDALLSFEPQTSNF